jgi:subtilisin family serine protease
VKTRFRRSVVLLAAAAVVAAPAPALAEEPVSAEVQHVPAALADDLSSAEEHTLSDLTDGGGVPLSAFVETAHGPQVVTLDAGSTRDAAAAAALLDAQPSVQAADVSVTMRAAGGAFEQYGNEMVRSAAARALVTGPLSAVVVAVLDTGVGPHAELNAALLPGRNFTDSPGGSTDTTDRYGHGTHVAGTIGADVGSYVEGVAAGVRILPVKVMSDTGSGYSSSVASGIVWAADHGAAVINMSLGAPVADDVVPAAIAYARSKGVTIVAAAGNDDSSAPFYPAAYSGVIAVSAVDDQEAKASFSNYGSDVDVAAPGVGILSTYPGDRFASMSGTSMATPHVAGIAALAKATAPSLTPDQVELAIENSATDLGAPGRDDIFGRGLVDAVRAVQLARSLVARPTPPPAPRITALAAGRGAVGVRWVAPATTGSAPVSSYVVRAYSGATLVKSVPAAPSARSLTLTGLVNGRAYTVTVGAVSAAGAGPAARSAVVVPRTLPSAPRIRAASAGHRSVVLRWAAPASNGGAAVSKYVVRTYRGRTLVRSTTVSSRSTAVTVSRLTPRLPYTFRVYAVNAAGTSPVSATVTVRPRR